MEADTFDRLREIVYEQSGISLGPKKEALVSARVGKRMRVLGISDFKSYLKYFDENSDEVVGLLDAVSTNVTSFFRESHHFEYVAEEAAEAYSAGQRRFRYWSAACSTGEEPYSLAMVLRETLPYPDLDLRILATDISTQALARCTEATYDLRRLQPVPHDLRERWFKPAVCDGEQGLVVKRELQNLIVFKRLNLSQPPFPMKGPLDAVFCRNVMIYFDDTVRLRLLEEINRLLRPGGLLYVGHAESLAGMISDFKFVRPSIYRKV
jgi:chemotaxis protein methyltransferase CheR